MKQFNSIYKIQTSLIADPILDIEIDVYEDQFKYFVVNLFITEFISDIVVLNEWFAISL
ncbi:hypothetical protein [Solibacillus sp. FSL H8-0538]|uniref:hypothetical protein n=1 Tax=Solibacillus sp. FSL H8-0538 TaxID=2921400 RepID=UPI0030FCF87C